MPLIIPISENTLFIEFEQVMSVEINDQVHYLHKLITTQLAESLLDSVPAYASIHLTFKESVPIKTAITNIQTIVDSFEQSPTDFFNTRLLNKESSKHISIPVYYGEKVAPDLTSIAQAASLSVNEVIALHSSPEYRVYAVGFLPGFPYLGNVPEKIATARKAEPHKRVPTGSVGIADQQTGIYPVDSPGGWQIIGRTPLSLITNDEKQPSLIQACDYISFNPISYDEFIALGGDDSWD